jgi:histidinol-phosphate/aromatic aminotransferase/cobyric acid decarboxylase-like protein
MIKVDVTRNLIGLEDLLTGVGTVTQTRGGNTVSITKINAQNLPFDEATTLAEKINFIDTQYNYFVENQSRLDTALEMLDLLQQLDVSIEELTLWLTNGSNQLSAFHAYAQTVSEDQTLISGRNYVMLEDTIIEDGVTVTINPGANLYLLTGIGVP